MEQYLVIVEKIVVADTNNLWKALAIMITWYYIVDRVYPSECINMHLFVEKALLSLSLSGKMNNSALQTISIIDQLESTDIAILNNTTD